MAANEVRLEGRITEPELRFTPNNKAICTVSMAIDFRKQVDGKWVVDDDKTMWFRLVCWERKGQLLALMPKGQLLHVEGRLQQRTWQDNNDNRREVVEIVVTDFYVPVISDKGMEVEGNEIRFFRPKNRDKAVSNGIERGVSQGTLADYDEEPF